MTILLDTHVIVWFRADPERLGRATRKMLRASGTDVRISVVSSLEIAQLVFKGRVSLPCDVEGWMRESRRVFNCEETPLTTQIAQEAYRLPGTFHPDPADRLLVATARLQHWSILTADRRILDYPHVAGVPAER
jgi:PIN domain nuclease of toxin-antitoxin system